MTERQKVKRDRDGSHSGGAEQLKTKGFYLLKVCWRLQKGRDKNDQTLLGLLYVRDFKTKVLEK